MANTENSGSKPIITVEVASRKNSSILFGGTGEKLRGRWTSSNVARHDMHDAMKRLSEIPVIPGIRIQIDFNERVCRIYDPLVSTKEGREVWAEVSKVMKEFKGLFGNEAMEPWPEQRIDNADNDTMKNWLYWIRRSYDTQHVVIIESESNVRELPTIEKIRGLPGRRVRSPFNVTQSNSEERRYTDNVPAKGAQLSAAGS